MGEVGGKAKAANVCDLIVIKVKNSEVSTHGEITLKSNIKLLNSKYKQSVTINVLKNEYSQYLQYSCWKSVGG